MVNTVVSDNKFHIRIEEGIKLFRTSNSWFCWKVITTQQDQSCEGFSCFIFYTKISSFMMEAPFM